MRAYFIHSGRKRIYILGLFATALIIGIMTASSLFSNHNAQAITLTNMAQIGLPGYDPFCPSLADLNAWAKKTGSPLIKGDEVQFSKWMTSHKYLASYNVQGMSEFMDHGPYSNLTVERYTNKSLNFMLEQIGDSLQPNKAPQTITTFSPPRSVNWTEKGAVSPVQNQSTCGSCYAFAAAGVLEGLAFLKSNKKFSFSEQQIIDCSQGSYNNSGCAGGNVENSLNFILANKGIATSSVYPLNSMGASAKCLTASEAWDGLSGFTTVYGTNTSEALITALAHMPTAVSVNVACLGLYTYTGGVIKFNASCSGSVPDHTVLAVGYDLDQAFYILKNSWGISWGENGYFRVAKSDQEAGTGGIHRTLVYAY